MPTIIRLLSGRPLVTLPPSASALDAARAMEREHVGAVLIVDEQGRAAGIFTERDLTRKVVVAGLEAGKVLLGQVMTTELFTVGPDALVEDVRRELQDRHIRHVPVLRDGVPFSMLSLRDLLRATVRDLRNEAQALQDYVQGGGGFEIKPDQP